MPLELKEIEQRKTEFQPLYDRHDTDLDLYWNKAYEMKMITDETKPVPRIVNITLNDAILFAFRCIGILQSASPQTIVESKERVRDSYIERMLDDYYITIDENMGNRALIGMYPFHVEQSCVRGSLAAQILNRKGKDGKPVKDVRPLDTRYFWYDMGMDGMNWGSYLTRQSRTYILEKLGKDIGVEKDALVYDVYSRKRHLAWVGQGQNAEQVRDEEHPYASENNGEGYVPIIYKRVPSGSMLADPLNVAHEGESIFALNRLLYPEMNRMATVLHNLTMASFFGARQYASDAGEGKEVEAIPFGLGVVVSIEKGGGYTLIPVNDIRNATRLEYAMIEGRLQRGSLPNVDYGNLSFPLSGAAIYRLTESRDQIFVPRLQCFAMFYQAMSRMVIKQIIQMGLPVELGEEGGRTTYEPAKLKGEYRLQYKYFSESREQKLAEITEAQSMRGVIPDRAIRIEILKRRHPEEDEDGLRDEQSERDDIRIRLYRRVHSLITRAEQATGEEAKRYDTEAKLTLKSLLRILKESTMQDEMALGAGQQPKQLERGKPPVSLLGEGGGGGGRQATSEEEVGAEIDEEDRIARLAETARGGRTQEALVETAKSKPRARRT